MGGCRCTYRNCTSRSDEKLHFFHYPVFDKIRCHQWLANAQRFDFLNLKVSQLKNRVVCQHHFKDKLFMNYKKDKLTYDAIPTEDGPNCKPHVKNCSLEIIADIPIQNSDDKVLLTRGERLASSQVKYVDYLTKTELTEIDAFDKLNINHKNKINVNNVKNKRKRLMRENLNAGEADRKMNLSKEPLHITDKTYPENRIISQDNALSTQESYLQQMQQMETASKHTFPERHIIINQSTGDLGNSINNSQSNINEKIVQLNAQLMSQEQNAFTNHLDPNYILKEWERDTPNAPNKKEQNAKTIEVELPSVENKTEVKDLKPESKVKILSEKKMSEPIFMTRSGELWNVTPSFVLTMPEKRFPSQPLVQDPYNSFQIVDIMPENNYLQQNGENIERQHLIELNQNMNANVNQLIQNFNNQLQPISNGKIDKPYTLKQKIFRNKSILKRNRITKISPDRIAAIEKKRKFNMKLRDIVEASLNKTDQNEYDSKISSQESSVPIRNNKHKYADFTTFQQCLISSLDSKMKRLEDNLLNRIDANTQKIGEIKTCVYDKQKKSTRKVSIQTEWTEEAKIRHHFNEISQYISPHLKSLLYEELFLTTKTKQNKRKSKRVKAK